MATTWVLITNGTSGKILGIENQKFNREEKSFFHPQTAKKDGDEGPSLDYSGEIEDYERHVFAKEISDHINKALVLNQFDKLIIVASRNMLGELRKAFSATVKKHIEYELDKDIISQRLSNEELLDEIRHDLGLLHW
jgi:protein required for attachment to host cells